MDDGDHVAKDWFLTIASVKHDDHVELADMEEVHYRTYLVLWHVWRKDKRPNAEFRQEVLNAVSLDDIVHVHDTFAFDNRELQEVEKHEELVKALLAQTVQMLHLLKLRLLLDLFVDLDN